MQARTSYDFYLLRMPAFPIEYLFRLNASLERWIAGGEVSDLQLLFSAPEFLEAIYLASKDLYELTQDWLGGKLKDEKKTEKLLKSLHKYYSRMCSRCTPYGLFAGCATGAISSMDSGFLFSDEKMIRSSRFDMNFSAALVRQLVNLPDIRRHVKFRPNNTLYKTGTQFRFIEYVLKEKGRSYAISALTETSYISKLLLRASTGDGATVREMTCSLEESGISEGSCEAFVNSLIDMQFFVSEFDPSVTGPDFFEAIIEKIAAVPVAGEIKTSLMRAYAVLRTGNTGLESYIRAKDGIRKWELPEKTDTIQTDMFFRMSDNHLNTRVSLEISTTARKLSAVVRAQSPPDLEEFKKRFADRYEDREAPLSVVLDPDSGVGYGWAVSGNVENMPLLSHLDIPSAPWTPVAGMEKFSQVAGSKARSFFRNGTRIMELTDQELDFLSDRPVGPASHPTSTYIMGTVIAGSAGDIDAGNYLFHASVIDAPYAGKLFARFSYSDPVLEEKLKNCLADEQKVYPDAILAEIVHLPEDRVGNVIIRPQLRAYEIPYLCRSTLEKERQIPLEDLYVSLKNDRIILRSAKLNREIIPRLTNAHMHQRGLPVYRLLCDLQYQAINPGFTWNWDVYSEAPHLPRIQYRKFILCRERWYLKNSDFSSAGQEGKMKAAIRLFRAEYNMPRYVILQQLDNELLIDMDNEFGLDHITSQLKKKNVTLYEFLSLPDSCFLKDAMGSYVTEIVIPVPAESSPATGAPGAAARDIAPGAAFSGIAPGTHAAPPLTRRFFPPGTEWCYFKIYTGNKIAEKVLATIIRPFTERLIRENRIDQFFFLRYKDPDFHIRLRLKLTPGMDRLMEIPVLLNKDLLPMIENGLVSRVTIDTYVREIERYGDDTMAPSEELFFSDSRAVLDFIDMIEGNEGELVRWQMAIFSIDLLLADFGYDLPGKRDLMRSLSRAFFREFNQNMKESESRLSRSLNDKYRQDYRTIDRILNEEGHGSEMAAAFSCFKQRSLANAPIVRRIKELIRCGAGSPVRTIDELMTSYIHMSLNRIFLSRPRMHELVVYHYLNKYYDSRIQRYEQAKKIMTYGNVDLPDER